MFSHHLLPSFSFLSSNGKPSAGAPYPLGATWDGRGTNFALFSANATKVELCLFDSEGNNNWGVIMAGTTFVVLPLLIVYVFSQRFIIDGLTAGATKG